MTPSIDLAALFDRLAEAAKGSPTVALVPGEARALGGSLFASAPLLLELQEQVAAQTGGG